MSIKGSLKGKAQALAGNAAKPLLGFAGAQLINRVFGNRWGIFNQSGIPLLLVDNVVTVKYGGKSQVSSAPIEQGSFASYNKVAEPFSLTVRVSKASGGVVARGAFLALLETLAASTDLFMVITPEAVYPNCAITGYDYRREASDGARMIKADIHLQEVRQVRVEYKHTKAPDAQTEQDAGRVQPESAADAPPPAKTAPDESLLHRGGKWLGIL